MTTSHQNKRHEKPHASITREEINQGKSMAILAYILAPIPYFAEKKNKFVRFHAVQGMNILIVAVAYWLIQYFILGIVSNISVGSCAAGNIVSCYGSFGVVGVFSFIFSLIGLAIFALDIVGLVYAAQGLTKEVPILGKIKIIKK